MEEKGIKVVIDYARGYYTVAGVISGNVYTINKPIRGVDNDGYYKDNFSRRLLNRRKNQIIRRLKSIQRREPRFRYSKNLIGKVDPMLFKVLEDWDETAGTNYSSEYLKIVTQKFKTRQYPDAPKGSLTDNLKKARMANMVDAGIEVSYNVGIFNSNRNLSLFDKFRGIRFARAQRDMLGVEYHYSTSIKKDYYLPKMDEFIAILKKSPASDQIEKETADVVEPLGMSLEEILAEYEAQRREETVSESVESVSESIEAKETSADPMEAELVEATIEPKSVEENSETPIRKTPRPGGRVERRILAEKRHWTRKLRDAKDSIKNKKFKPHLSEKGKKIVITGAVTLLAAGIIFAGGKIWNELENGNQINPARVETNIGTIIIPAETQTEVKENETGEEDKTTIENGIEDTSEPGAPVSPERPGVIVTEQDQEDEMPIVQDHEKSEDEKMVEFKEAAVKAYRDAIVIGEIPAVGDLFAGQKYSENPDGTGRKGSFDKHPEYRISHINIVTKDGWHTVRLEGKNLSDLLAEYPDMITYNFHVVNSKTGGWLGFVTQEQYEGLIQNKVNQIIDSRMNQDLER